MAKGSFVNSLFVLPPSLILGVTVLVTVSTPFCVWGDDGATQLEECQEKSYPEKTSCYQKGLERLLRAHGTEQALEALKQLAAQDPAMLRDAHPYAHHVGRASVAHYKDAQTAFSHCRDTFWSGCYHGVLEGYLGSLPRVEPHHIATLCTENIDANQSVFLRYQCLHGLGHGLTVHFQHDVPKALSFCDALTTQWDRVSCYGGVFMENIVAFQNALHNLHRGHHTSHTTFLDPNDPLYPCNVLDKKYQPTCYLMQSSAILTFTNHDFAQAFRECSKAPAEFVPTCYQSLGRDISGFTTRNIGKIISLCGLGEQEAISHCLIGAVKDIILTHAEPQRGLAFCRRLEDPMQKKGCYAAVGEVLASLYPDQGRREQACAIAEAQYVALCEASVYKY